MHREDVFARVHLEIDASSAGIEHLGPHPVTRRDEPERDLDLGSDRLPSRTSGRRTEPVQEIPDVESGNRALRDRVEERGLQRVVASFVGGGGRGHGEGPILGRGPGNGKPSQSVRPDHGRIVRRVRAGVPSGEGR